MTTKPESRKTMRKEAGKRELDPNEKEDYLEQVEEYEGPNRREPHAGAPEVPKEPGVARS